MAWHTTTWRFHECRCTSDASHENFMTFPINKMELEPISFQTPRGRISAKQRCPHKKAPRTLQSGATVIHKLKLAAGVAALPLFLLVIFSLLGLTALALILRLLLADLFLGFGTRAVLRLIGVFVFHSAYSLMKVLRQSQTFRLRNCLYTIRRS